MRADGADVGYSLRRMANSAVVSQQCSQSCKFVELTLVLFVLCTRAAEVQLWIVDGCGTLMFFVPSLHCTEQGANLFGSWVGA